VSIHFVCCLSFIKVWRWIDLIRNLLPKPAKREYKLCFCWLFILLFRLFSQQFFAEDKFFPDVTFSRWKSTPRHFGNSKLLRQSVIFQKTRNFQEITSFHDADGLVLWLVSLFVSYWKTEKVADVDSTVDITWLAVDLISSFWNPIGSVSVNISCLNLRVSMKISRK